MRYADQTRARHQTGQGDLFSLAGEQRTDDLHREILANIEPVEEWDDSERLYGEKETLGLYLSGHPVDAFDQELNALVSRRIGDLEMPAAAGGSRWARPKGQELVIAGLVVAARHNKTQRGRMASVTLDDRTGRIEVTVFSELYEQCRTLLEADRILVVQGHLGFDEYRDRLSLTASSLLDLNDARNQWARRLCLRLGQRRLKQLGIDGVQFAGQLKERLSPHLGGGCELQLDYENASCAGSLLFSGNWRLHPDAELIRGLKRWIGADALQVRYQRPGAVGAGNA